MLLLAATLLFASNDAAAQQSNADFDIDDTSFAENVGNATFEMTSRRAGGNAFGVRVSVHNGTGSNAATLNSDFRDVTTSAGSKSFFLGHLPRTITIPIINDTTREDDEVFIFRVEIFGSGAKTVNVPITIEKNDQPAVATLSVNPVGNVQITEGDTQVFRVTLSPSLTQQVTVKCQTLSGGVAVAGSDYTALDETLTFPAYTSTPMPVSVQRTCRLETIDDTESEADTETVKFGLTDLTGGGVETDGSGGVTIMTGHDSFDVLIADNDQPPSTLSFPDGSTGVAEDVGTAMVRVNLAATRPIIENVTVRCHTFDRPSGQQPEVGVDYTSANETLTFTPSDVSGATTNVTKNCPIPIIDDAVDEGQENISVVLADPTGGATIASSSRSINLRIDDNDDGPSIWLEQASPPRVVEGTATYAFTARLSEATGKPDIGVGYRFGGTATLGYEATASAGDDYIVSGGTTNYFGGNSRDGSGNLTFARGETSKTLTIEIQDDQLKEADETIVLELHQDPDETANALLNNATAHEDGTVDQNRNTTTLTLESDEKGTATLKLRQPGETGFVERLRVPEGDGAEGNVAIAFQVELDIDELPSTIGVTLRDGTAETGEDYAPLAGGTLQLAVTPGTSPEFEVEILHDEESEGPEYFEIVLEGSEGDPIGDPFRVSIDDDDGPDPILRETAKFATARAEALIENQPRLIPMLRDPDNRSEFKLRASDRGVEAAGGFRAETVWGETALSRSVDDGREHEHLLTTLGANYRMSERFHLGGMLQFDRSGMKPGEAGASGEIGGRGWMAGPYFAARDAAHPLFFEGRLLYGRASNDVDALVIVLDGQSQDPRSASFDSERWLAQARVEGTYRLGNGATLIPLADLSHARDEMEPFLASDDPGNLIDGQTTALTKLQIGAELEIPVDTARGDLLLRPGLRFVASDSSGGAFAGEAGEEAGPRSRGRIDFGIDYMLDDGLVLGFGSFYSGLGRKDLESYGAGLDLQLEF